MLELVFVGVVVIVVHDAVVVVCVVVNMRLHINLSVLG